jgi:FtsH-binding integral membrane protein
MEMLNMEQHDTAKHVVDALSVVTVVGALVQLLPAIAALFTILWTGIRIWETQTVQKLCGRTPKNIEVQNESQN